jgi:hypothetical protein
MQAGPRSYPNRAIILDGEFGLPLLVCGDCDECRTGSCAPLDLGSNFAVGLRAAASQRRALPHLRCRPDGLEGIVTLTTCAEWRLWGPNADFPTP